MCASTFSMSVFVTFITLFTNILYILSRYYLCLLSLESAEPLFSGPPGNHPRDNVTWMPYLGSLLVRRISSRRPPKLETLNISKNPLWIRHFFYR